MDLAARLTGKHRALALAKQQGVSLNQFILWSVAEKVSALKAGLDDPNFPGIAFRRGASGIPVPVLRGTGIRVQTIVISNREWNETQARSRHNMSCLRAWLNRL